MSFVVATDQFVPGSADWGVYQSVSLQRLMQRILDEGGFGFGQYGVATGGSTAYEILDTTRLLSGQYPQSYWKNAWVRIASNITGGSGGKEGEIRTVSEYDRDQGKLTVTPPFSEPVVAGDSYELWRYLHPQIVRNIIRTVLERRVLRRQWTVLSADLNTDYDIGQGQQWQTGGAGMAMTKNTQGDTAHPIEGVTGRNYATMTDSIRDGAQFAYWATDYHVKPGQTYHASVAFSWTAGQSGSKASFQIRNSNITTVIAEREISWPHFGRVYVEFTAPEGNQTVYFTIANEQAGKTMGLRLDDFVFMEKPSASLPLPLWLPRQSSLIHVYELLMKESSAGLVEPALVGRPMGEYGILQGAQGMSLVNRSGGFHKPVVIFAERPEQDFTNNVTDRKRMNEDEIVAYCLHDIFSHLSSAPATQIDNGQWVVTRAAIWQARVNELEKRKDERFEDDRHVGQTEQYYAGDTYLAGID